MTQPAVFTVPVQYRQRVPIRVVELPRVPVTVTPGPHVVVEPRG